jgi:hypothetical protein
MVLSIYDNIQISTVGTDLLRFRLGIFARAADEPGAIAIVGSAFAVALGSRRPQNCLAGDRPEYDRLFARNDDRE